MIPILYSPTETEFKTMGLGGLSDTLSASVEEEVNGPYELEMEYPVGGKHESEIDTESIIYTKANDDTEPEPFRIYKIKKEPDKITVNAHHISYDLSGVPLAPFSAKGITEALAGFKKYGLLSHPFTFESNISNDSTTFSNGAPASLRSRLAGSEGSLLQRFRGEYQFNRFKVKLLAHRGQDNGVTIRYGKNLTSLSQEKEIDAVYTGVLAYWYKEDEGEIQTGEIQYLENHKSYPRENIFILDCSSDYEEKPAVQQLNLKAQQYRDNNDVGVPKVSLDVEFVPLWQTEEYKDIAPLEKVKLGDTVHVVFEELGVSADAEVVKTEYDPLSERYTKVTIGSVKANMSDAMAEATQKTMEPMIQSIATVAANRASDWLKGGLGGHVVMIANANGGLEEQCIMDTEDIETAVNVWRWNLRGLGFSSTGYNGNFGIAITSDGQINADFITVGTLAADRVKIGNRTLTEQNDVIESTVEESRKPWYILSTSKRTWNENSYIKLGEQTFLGSDVYMVEPLDPWEWTEEIPDDVLGHYLWVKYEVTHMDGSKSWTEPRLSEIIGYARTLSEHRTSIEKNEYEIALRATSKELATAQNELTGLVEQERVDRDAAIKVASDAITAQVSTKIQGKANKVNFFRIQVDEGVVPPTPEKGQDPADLGWVQGNVSWINGKHVWQLIQTIYSDGDGDGQDDIVYDVPVDITGAKGADGENSEAVKITANWTKYKVGISADTEPDGEWKDWNAIKSQVVEGKFLWAYTYTAYNTGESNGSYGVSYIGKDGAKGEPGTPGTNGADGRGIVSQKIQWKTSTSPTDYQASSQLFLGSSTFLGKHTFMTEQIDSDKSWSDKQPDEYVPGHYLWQKLITTYSDDSEDIIITSQLQMASVYDRVVDVKTGVDVLQREVDLYANQLETYKNAFNQYQIETNAQISLMPGEIMQSVSKSYLNLQDAEKTYTKKAEIIMTVNDDSSGIKLSADKIDMAASSFKLAVDNATGVKDGDYASQSYVDGIASDILDTANNVASGYASTAKNDAIKEANSNTTKVIKAYPKKAEIIATINSVGQSEAKISASMINLDGYVTLSNLKGEGTTEINGSNIKSGTISAVRITSDNSATKSKIVLDDGILSTYDKNGNVGLMMFGQKLSAYSWTEPEKKVGEFATLESSDYKFIGIVAEEDSGIEIGRTITKDGKSVISNVLQSSSDKGTFLCHESEGNQKGFNQIGFKEDYAAISVSSGPVFQATSNFTTLYCRNNGDTRLSVTENGISATVARQHNIYIGDSGFTVAWGGKTKMRYGKDKDRMYSFNGTDLGSNVVSTGVKGGDGDHAISIAWDGTYLNFFVDGLFMKRM